MKIKHLNSVKLKKKILKDRLENNNKKKVHKEKINVKFHYKKLNKRQ